MSTTQSSLEIRTPEQIKAALIDFASPCVAAAVRYLESNAADALMEMLPGMIEFHLPSGTSRPPALLTDELRLSQDLGLDSLALTEMALKFDDLLGIPIETRELSAIRTVGDLKAFLRRKAARA
jgi:acyl carrier protein